MTRFSAWLGGFPGLALAGLVLAVLGAAAGVEYGNRVRDPYLSGDYGDLLDWQLAVGAPHSAKMEFPESPGHGIRVVPRLARPEEPGCVEVSFPSPPLTEGHTYLLSFRARSDAPRSMACLVRQHQSPFRKAGLVWDVATTETWQAFRFRFVAQLTDPQLRIDFFVGNSEVPVEISHLELTADEPDVPGRFESQSP